MPPLALVITTRYCLQLWFATNSGLSFLLQKYICMWIYMFLSHKLTKLGYSYKMENYIKFKWKITRRSYKCLIIKKSFILTTAVQYHSNPITLFTHGALSSSQRNTFRYQLLICFAISHWIKRKYYWLEGPYYLNLLHSAPSGSLLFTCRGSKTM